MPIITMFETRRFSGSPPRRVVGAGPIVETIARQHDLADDLGCRQIADEPLRAGVAEGAIERAADLARNAQRAAVGFRNVDAFDFVRRAAMLARKPKQPFARAVDGNLFGRDFGALKRKALRQRRAQILRQGRHLVEALRAANVEPVPDLLRPHAALPLRHIDCAERFHQGVARKTDERRILRRQISLERKLLGERGRGLRFRHGQRSGHRQSKRRRRP